MIYLFVIGYFIISIIHLFYVFPRIQPYFDFNESFLWGLFWPLYYIFLFVVVCAYIAMDPSSIFELKPFCYLFDWLKQMYYKQVDKHKNKE